MIIIKKFSWSDPVYAELDKLSRIFYNLTNGLETLEYFSEQAFTIQTIRIASTDLEQHNFNRVISDLDYNFLFALATGQRILIMDASSNKNISRALFQGVPFIEFVLNKEWFDKTEKTFVRNMNVTKYFEEEYNKLTDESLRKIRYFKKLVTCTSLQIYVYCGKSILDGKYNEFKKLLERLN